MPNKTEEYLALACKTADSFSRQWEHWAEFLITAARLYKYSYPDQLMIYAQRPDATACAEYVFDVSDTAPRRNALYPDLWQINESLKEPVRSMLAENYGVHSESFGQQLADVAGKLVQSYAAYRKVGYSKAFLEAHREEITLHKAAKAAFDEAGLQKLPKVKELDAEFAELLTKKKASYPDYRKARNEMQELVRAQKNVERFFAEEKDTTEKTQTR